MKLSAVLVLGYLGAIVAANLITTHYAEQGHPEVSVYCAAGLVAFDLVSRDRLHDLWGSYRWLGMAGLILVGSLLSYWINADAGAIAVASSAAFAAGLTVDAVVYEAGRRRGWPWLLRSNASNIVGGAVDSVVFVAIAFPGFLAAVAFNQWTAKVAGGLVLGYLLRPRPRELRGELVHFEGHAELAHVEVPGGARGR